MKTYRAGVDIGSTTVKLLILDEENQTVFASYRRHLADTVGTLTQLLNEVKTELGDVTLQLKMTGSGALHLGKALRVDFVQEVVAVAKALKKIAPKTDVAIELGGEDAKIIYFTSGVEERMNGVCAGGTGSFIDQMAALLQTDAAGLNDYAEHYEEIYPIAARCGVFAKTDIQPLINEGATKPDLAASIFQAVVNQTVSGLACGKPIRGTVAFLGGPLHFLPQLKKAFIRTLNLTEETTVDPENSHLLAAMGAALSAEKNDEKTLSELLTAFEKGIFVAYEMPRLPALFETQEDYAAFCHRHEKAVLPKGNLSSYTGNCYLGIDAGSTTTKIALIGESGELLFSEYSSNLGSPLEIAKKALAKLEKAMPQSARIAGSCSTGYGEGLMKAAFSLDEGEVETACHYTAAAFFDPLVDCVLDIGGQDMKCIKIKNNAIDSILLNEACSSGCGSFLENFANSMGMSAEEFANQALFATHPVDLGTRCTVFMNSNVKQAQKEGAPLGDISAGLAYSVIKNALYKVIKLASAEDLGKRIVVQGGTFYNKAVLRALESITGVEVISPDIAGLMGAFGAALTAKNHSTGESKMKPLSQCTCLSYENSCRRCGGCQNNCMLTFTRFPDGGRYITGNRCERGQSGKGEKSLGKNLFQYKRERMFSYEPLPAEEAVRGVIGLPRVLNVYENYPFWASFFKALQFRTVLSPFSNRKIYEMGMESIPSESECYPAKLTHGHIKWLIEEGVQTIFYPCVFYEKKEIQGADNHFNCPIVAGYPENLKNNVEELREKNVRYLHPFLAFTDEKTITERLVVLAKEYWHIPTKETRRAVQLAWREQEKAKTDIRTYGKQLLEEMEACGGKGVVLVGRPYHIDPEINHGIPELIASYGLYVFTEDSLPVSFSSQRPLRVVDQWVYHSRLYAAAEFVSARDDMELLQLNSFGCGLDAVTTDQVSEMLEAAGKLYTVLKIDEVNNLGAVRIRIRSLMAAMKQREEQGKHAISPNSLVYERAEFTKKMRGDGYTILAPRMSPIHFDLLEPVFRKHGYKLVILDNDNRSAVDTGLKFVNNDACYPSIVMVGQFMNAVLSGDYDTNRLALIMTQTGGCCRASNYIAFIRRALEKAGLSHIPVISLNAGGMEQNEGFRLTLPMIVDAGKAIVFGDLMMKCLYRTRPYERTRGSADEMYQTWQRVCTDYLLTGKGSYAGICKGIVSDFDALPLDETIKKPRVGIVGEILVKYMPLANNNLVELLEREGAEAVVPDFLDFMDYSLYGGIYKAQYLGGKKSGAAISRVGISLIEAVRHPATSALKKSRRFSASESIDEIAAHTEPFLSLGNQYGEGWFLAGEMLELLHQGVENIICIQPFACLPNHVVGKGVIKPLREAFPTSNIVAVDYDPGASQVNQLNRIKLMLSNAKKKGE